ncbi:MAG: hypothetical protein IJ523_07910 [Succinivibrionaceae bacterium]|nr:hypothetical protein [Succinivibrionaceae bacterium]
MEFEIREEVNLVEVVKRNPDRYECYPCSVAGLVEVFDKSGKFIGVVFMKAFRKERLIFKKEG